MTARNSGIDNGEEFARPRTLNLDTVHIYDGGKMVTARYAVNRASWRWVSGANFGEIADTIESREGIDAARVVELLDMLLEHGAVVND